MMRHEEMVKKLVELGIPEKEASIYWALLQKRELTALEIQEIAHVPRTKVYEITHRMILHNMCIEKQVGSKRKYQAVDPEKVLDSLICEKEKDLNYKRSIAKGIKKMARPVYERGINHFDTLENVEIIRDLPSIHERFVILTKNTKKEIIGLAKDPYSHQYDETKLKEQNDAFHERIKKGVEVRIVYEIPARDKIEWSYNHIRKCVQAGEKARFIKSLPIKVYIFDQRHILMALANVESDPDDNRLVTFVVDHAPLAQLARLFFEQLWKLAKDYTILKSLVGKNQGGRNANN